MIDLIHEWAPVVNTGLMLLFSGGIIYLIQASRGWTLPGQDAKLSALALRVSEATGLASRADSSARIAHDSIDYSVRALTGEFAKVNKRLDELLGIREMVRTLEERLDHEEQGLEGIKAQLSALRCAEKTWHETERPGYCPLKGEDCPLTRKDE